MNEEQNLEYGTQEATQITTPSMYGTLDPELIRYILSPDPLMQQLEIKLLRLEWDDKEKKYIQTSTPICTVEAVKDFLAIIGALADKGIVLSNFDQKMIGKKMQDIMFMFIDLISLRRRRYEIHKEHLDMVRVIFEQTVEATLRRSYKGQGMKTISNSMERKEIVSTPQRRKLFW